MKVTEIRAKSILNRHRKRDDWFLDDYSANPYSGCSFNCIYCYIRGSKYGTDKQGISVKVNGPELLRKQLKRRAEEGEYGIIALGSATEPYMPIEEKYRLTRKFLEVILEFRFPVEVGTRSTLIIRDLDLLKEIDRNAVLPEDLKVKPGRGAIVIFSFSTLDADLAGIFEPGAPEPEERLETMKRCSEAGLLAGAAFIPVLPFLSDSEEALDEMMRKARDYGARFVFVGGLTLFGNRPSDCRMTYFRTLERHFPELVLSYKRLFLGSFAPPRSYQRELEKRARELAFKYGLQYGLA
ncbi:MAG TPA: radical SAM protein [Deltaproteobacteria bacterium]|nr:MAG: radical SAM protein [Candidatus Hydrothermae bacterium]HDM77082.1 radical SAM protein [Deltaproteobacteria bacterium]